MKISGTYTLKTGIVIENGDLIPNFLFSNKNKMLNENVNPIPIKKFISVTN